MIIKYTVNILQSSNNYDQTQTLVYVFEYNIESQIRRFSNCVWIIIIISCLTTSSCVMLYRNSVIILLLWLLCKYLDSFKSSSILYFFFKYYIKCQNCLKNQTKLFVEIIDCVNRIAINVINLRLSSVYRLHTL
jgi:hypothetical protein